MRIWAAMDLLDGRVVRGVAGERANYLPVASTLVVGCEPLAVAKALRARLGVEHLYVADLDAIAGIEPSLGLIHQLVAEGFTLAVDAGARRAGDAARLAEAGAQVVVLGSETLEDPSELTHVVDRWGAPRVLFSLDMKKGSTLVAAPCWRTALPLDILADASKAGVTQVLLLDLARVGLGRGTGGEDLLREAKARWPATSFWMGGGVASIADLRRLASLEVDAVLVASALHDGRITLDDLKGPWLGA